MSRVLPLLACALLAACATQAPPTPPPASTIAPDVTGAATTVPVPPTSDDTDLATMRADFIAATAERFDLEADDGD